MFHPVHEMSKVFNGNGHGNGANGLLLQPKKRGAKPPAAAPLSDVKESQVTFQTMEGVELHGTLVRVTRHGAVFELYNPGIAPRLSEVLGGFQIILQGRTIYSGRAVVSNIVDAGSKVVCEAKLDDPGVHAGINMPFNGNISLLDAYHTFFDKWQNQTKLLPEFKMVVLDLQSYLSDLKLLLEQVEISITAHPSRNRSELEPEVFKDLAPVILSSMDTLRERLLDIAGRIQPDLYVAHQAFMQRQLHPLFLCAPFGHRTYHKPLGYAGDYGMMNMIHRNTFEGGSLYAKMMHYWLVNQAPAKSVRNRVAHIKTKLIEETARVVREKRAARILNLGCGPAYEVKEFMSEHRLADHAEFTLLDFNTETLDYVTSTLGEIKTRYKRHTRIQIQQTSVTQLIKNSLSSSHSSLGSNFDLIYCGGLFDYLPDQMCRQLVGLFYEHLAPDGLVVTANMDDKVPFRQMLEFLLDWHLIYRDARCLSSFVPDNAPSDSWSVITEPVAVNLFLEVRKPKTN